MPQPLTTITKVADFEAIRLKIASADEIHSWSHGEVTKPETINYRTQRPEKDGLFDERIFGPTKDWECYCGKYRRIRYKGIVCDKCGVEVTRSIVRRERMGHIALAAPVAHIWFVRGVPSKIGTLLDLSIQELEKIIYFASYIIISVNAEARDQLLKEMDREYAAKTRIIQQGEKTDEAALAQLKALRDERREELRKLKPLAVLSEMAFRELSVHYGAVFEAGTGAGALRQITSLFNPEELALQLEEEAKRTASVQQLRKIFKRLRLVKNFARAGIRPENMFLMALPVMPPDLRPMVALDGGRFATSDVNDLYRRVINRNNRLKKLIELNAPEVIVRNEKRMLQEAVDALLDNSARRAQGTQAQAAGQHRALRSVADMLKGKQGRFRQNLLGKRVDYSGRSVIVVGADLKLYQCGLPKKMALELFKPFIIQKLIARELVHNIRAASRLIEQEVTEVWEILEEVIQDKYVLLNRAPTLHRLGIQAFKPVLIEGLAIEVHPLVCTAFNADFDGDQMAVHLPLSQEAQKEAQTIMLSAKNLLKPSTGEPIVTPTQDVVLGLYWMTRIAPGARGEGKIFSSRNEAIYAYQIGVVDLRARVTVRLQRGGSPAAAAAQSSEHKKNRRGRRKGDEPALASSAGISELVETCVGRIILSTVLPPEIGFLNREMNRAALRALVEDILRLCGVERSAEILDRIKNLGFTYATLSGISWGMDDIHIPSEKAQLLQEAEERVKEIRRHYEEGLLTDAERRSRIIEIWNSTRQKVVERVPKMLDPQGSIFTIFDSKARGSWEQTYQMAGMKGLVVNPASEVIELPVKSSFKEGLNVLEYFISTHGARKGTSDTALRTATAGYLTRRLVDVAQDVVVVEENCGDEEGLYVYREDALTLEHPLASRIFGRVILEDVRGPDGSLIAHKHELLTPEAAEAVEATGVDRIQVRSLLTCRTKFGVCQACYGYDLGHNRLVSLGEAVGIVTAQAIGEPGTQLTMRTFHTGGVASGGDITTGLPRVEEIFEARPPKGKAVLAEVAGTVLDIVESEKEWIVRILDESAAEPAEAAASTEEARDADLAVGDSGEESAAGASPAPSVEGQAQIREYRVRKGTMMLAKAEDRVVRGQQLCEGHIDLKELYRISGKEAVRRYVIREVQAIYNAQGAGINDKHIELIIHKMFSRVRIRSAGQTQLLPGMITEYDVFRLENERARAAGKEAASAVRLLLGITKAALTSDSFLAAASFQETAKILIQASSEGKTDHLRGLKENVIIGKLIPAGTGFRHRPII